MPTNGNSTYDVPVKPDEDNISDIKQIADTLKGQMTNTNRFNKQRQYEKPAE